MFTARLILACAMGLSLTLLASPVVATGVGGSIPGATLCVDLPPVSPEELELAGFVASVRVSDPLDFGQLLEAVAEELGCGFSRIFADGFESGSSWKWSDSSAARSTSTDQAMLRGMDCENTYCDPYDNVNVGAWYCGKGNSQSGLPPWGWGASDGLNRACFAHDLCYRNTCVESACPFPGDGSHAHPCDQEMLNVCHTLNATNAVDQIVCYLAEVVLPAVHAALVTDCDVPPCAQSDCNASTGTCDQECDDQGGDHDEDGLCDAMDGCIDLNHDGVCPGSPCDGWGGDHDADGTCDHFDECVLDGGSCRLHSFENFYTSFDLEPTPQYEYTSCSCRINQPLSCNSGWSEARYGIGINTSNQWAFKYDGKWANYYCPNQIQMPDFRWHNVSMQSGLLRFEHIPDANVLFCSSFPNTQVVAQAYSGYYSVASGYFSFAESVECVTPADTPACPFRSWTRWTGGAGSFAMPKIETSYETISKASLLREGCVLLPDWEPPVASNRK